MNNPTIEFLCAQKYVVERIKSNSYPRGHIFNSTSFTDNDYIVLIMSFLKSILVETDLINDYIDNKLKANNQGVFDVEKYFQGLNELTFLHYLLFGIVSNASVKLDYVYYEGFSPYNKSKKLEYQLVLDNSVMLNIEIKSITCDPIFKESNFKIDENLIYIKKYFKNTDLSFVNEFSKDKYRVLSECTHSRQLRKNINKIIEKFDGEHINNDKMINIGVVFIQFATSIEEFYSYLLNEKKGIIKGIDSKNLDCIVFFSLTARPQFDMQDIYDNGHVFTVLLSDKEYINPYLKVLRLDNIIAQKTMNNLEIVDSIKSFAEREYGKFKIVIDENSKCFFVSDEINEKDIKKYSQYINGEEEYPDLLL